MFDSMAVYFQDKKKLSTDITRCSTAYTCTFKTVFQEKLPMHGDEVCRA